MTINNNMATINETGTNARINVLIIKNPINFITPPIIKNKSEASKI
jgi:hypothetical protein